MPLQRAGGGLEGESGVTYSWEFHNWANLVRLMRSQWSHTEITGVVLEPLGPLKFWFGSWAAAISFVLFRSIAAIRVAAAENSNAEKAEIKCTVENVSISKNHYLERRSGERNTQKRQTTNLKKKHNKHGLSIFLNPSLSHLNILIFRTPVSS